MASAHIPTTKQPCTCECCVTRLRLLFELRPCAHAHAIDYKYIVCVYILRRIATSVVVAERLQEPMELVGSEAGSALAASAARGETHCSQRVRGRGG